MHVVHRKARTLGDQAQQAISALQPLRIEQLLKHEVNGCRANIASTRKIAEPAIDRDIEAMRLHGLMETRTEVL
ncbi:MAG: hypothetical protein AMJ84_05055 [Acidithiobacillales bacterium SM23_46]|nr:MAG: hypothetical protein AMJ84_05055 [Acidithiobacillales bacterium SM23_46]